MSTDQAAETLLLQNIKARLPELEALLDPARSHWNYEDPVYRYYHQSFKVFGVQHVTRSIVDALRSLLPDAEMDARFLAIIADGTGKEFGRSSTRDSCWRWL